MDTEPVVHVGRVVGRARLHATDMDCDHGESARERVARGAWLGIGLALLGALVLTGVDLSLSARALFGDALALTGGVLAAAYVTVGSDARRTMSTTVYTALCYPAAAAGLLAGCLVGGQNLTHYSAHTWWILVAISADHSCSDTHS